MTKADLIEKIAEKANLTKANAERSLNAFIDAVEDVLVKEGKLTLTGFGTFVVEERKERKGRNPRTGAEISIPAAKVVKFRPGKLLKEAIK
ncbi:HU family DNA-binding protein [Desulfovibrio mangrovi]|uniref:DNA-binding protein n=1 Tax=Desulfovibrio subterraneus TaxID=2718620 RepID=A0A7J0BLR0_9BACT|nr:MULTISPECIES: HU family DNA-binding protein [Desulfovibrio]UZP68389.1 HU family DNA-binding protein [Desulfovibrio mangrovi]WBF68119.1 HU family DNA-binding protein [Desulfovibrio subterraneus]GFM34004.1 DNA-binding protein [Desulfovibrio subterraneus]